jgi:hypothetical protein
MKKTLLLITSLFTLASVTKGQMLIVDEDFEGLADGAYVAASLGAPWTTWSGAAGTPEDAQVSMLQASSGTNSFMITSTTPATGGTTDLLLLLGDRTTGVYGLSWNMYIPAGNGGYFNIQHDEEPGVEWAIDVTFKADGTIELGANNATSNYSANYPHDEWFSVEFLINLNTMQGLFTMNGEAPYTWPFNTAVDATTGMNQLGSVNFFSYAGGDPVMYFVDDVIFIDLTNVGIAQLDADQARIYPNPVADQLTLEMPEMQIERLLVTDLSGRTVREMPVNGMQPTYRMDVASLASGTYLVRAITTEGELVKQIVKY